MTLAASRPPEERGLSRDGVRLLAATPDGIVHARFGDLPRFLSEATCWSSTPQPPSPPP
jgi:S-adenosylmethionine:tRNA ribosyltransferase-isomerase